MGEQTFQNVVDYTESTENPGLESGLFYYEPSTNTFNFGYGLNLTANISVSKDGVYSLPSNIAEIFDGLGIAFTQEQLKTIKESPSSSTLNNVDTDRSESEQLASADAATRSFFDIQVTAPLQRIFGTDTFDNLPDNVKMGLQDAYYNGPGTVGDNLRADIANHDFATAALELANFTPTMSANRRLYDALNILGAQPSVDLDSHQVVGVNLNGVKINGAPVGIDGAAPGSAYIDFGGSSNTAGVYYNTVNRNVTINSNATNIVLSSSVGVSKIDYRTGQFSVEIVGQANALTLDKSGSIWVGGTHITSTGSTTLSATVGANGLTLSPVSASSNWAVNLNPGDGSGTLTAGGASAPIQGGSLLTQGDDGSFRATHEVTLAGGGGL